MQFDESNSPVKPRAAMRSTKENIESGKIDKLTAQYNLFGQVKNYVDKTHLLDDEKSINVVKRDFRADRDRPEQIARNPEGKLIATYGRTRTELRREAENELAINQHNRARMRQAARLARCARPALAARRAAPSEFQSRAAPARTPTTM